MSDLPIKFYPQIAIVLEIVLGTTVCCLSGLVIAGYMKIYGWRKPSSLIFMNLLLVDFMNGLNGPLQAAYLHCLLKGIKAAELFRTIFFIQSTFLWVSLMVIVLLNISRLVAIMVPFQYQSIMSMRVTAIALAVSWVTGLINSLLKRYVSHYNKYKYYVSGVLFHLVLDVVIFGLALFTIGALRYPGDLSPTRIKATKTVVVVSMAFFLTYGYYIYVNVVWMIPGELCYGKPGPWLNFTACGKWSLSLAHIFLLMNSLFNGVLIGNIPSVRAGIEHLFVPNFYKYMSLRDITHTPQPRLRPIVSIAASRTTDIQVEEGNVQVAKQ